MNNLWKKITNKDRWIGLAIAVSSVYILSEANIDTQWIGWFLSIIACMMWVWFGYRDKDYPRALMELMYLLLSMRAMYNWLI
jgi:drug/metabolite transporter (DMT)-like permease